MRGPARTGHEVSRVPRGPLPMAAGLWPRGQDGAHLLMELGQSPQGRALAHRPPPATLGLLDPQPGCCAEIPEHKRPQSGQGWGRGCGQPSSMLTRTIGAFRAGRPSYHQRLCGTKRAFSALEPDDGQGGACGDTGTAGPWGPGPVLPLRAPPQLFPSLGLSFPGLSV